MPCADLTGPNRLAGPAAAWTWATALTSPGGGDVAGPVQGPAVRLMRTRVQTKTKNSVSQRNHNSSDGAEGQTLETAGCYGNRQQTQEEKQSGPVSSTAGLATLGFVSLTNVS